MVATLGEFLWVIFSVLADILVIASPELACFIYPIFFLNFSNICINLLCKRIGMLALCIIVKQRVTIHLVWIVIVFVYHIIKLRP